MNVRAPCALGLCGPFRRIKRLRKTRASHSGTTMALALASKPDDSNVSRLPAAGLASTRRGKPVATLKTAVSSSGPRAATASKNERSVVPGGKRCVTREPAREPRLSCATRRVKQERRTVWEAKRHSDDPRRASGGLSGKKLVLGTRLGRRSVARRRLSSLSLCFGRCGCVRCCSSLRGSCRLSGARLRLASAVGGKRRLILGILLLAVAPRPVQL